MQLNGNRLRTLFFMLGLAAMLTGACRSQEPIIIYVTPTLPSTEASAPPFDAAPTVTEGALTPPLTPSSTFTPAPTTVPPTPAPVAGTQEFGAITGPDYELPTQPPLPTATPGATFTPDLTRHPPLPNLDRSQMGVQIDQEVDPDVWAYALDRTTQLGVAWIKIQVAWMTYQPNGPDQMEGVVLDELDWFLLETERRGIRVLVSVAKAPYWARTDDTENGPPDDPQALANFVTFLLNRRGGYTIDAIEVWNEPNLLREWRGQPMTGASYMRYFAAAYNAIRAYSPSVPIITAGLAPTGNSDVSRDDRDYLREMYAAGLANYQDVFVGAHPYSWGNPPDARCCNLGTDRGWDDDPHFFFSENIDAVRTIMDQNGHQNVPIWVTEFGWATWDGFGTAAPEPWITYNNRWDQAHYTIRAFEIGQQRPDIGVMFLWNLNFATELHIQRRDERAAYGIVPAVTSIRPVFWMIYDAIRPDEELESYER